MSFFSAFGKKKSLSTTPTALQAPTTTLVGKHVTMEDHGNTVFCCAFSHDIVEGLDGKAVDLATASYDGTTRVWDLAKCAGNHSKKCRRILKGNPGGVWCCAYTHDSRFLVTGCSKGSICVYSAPQRYDLVGRQDSSHGPNAVFACSTGMIGNEHLLATAGGDTNLRLWQIATGEGGAGVKPKLKVSLGGHSGDVVSCAFRPHTNVLVSGSEDRHVRVWDIANQDCLQTLIGHTAEVCSTAYNRDGTVLATGSSDKTVKLWDARQKNRSFQTLEGHAASVYSVSFRRASFDLLASASQDGTVAVWDPRTWKCAQVLREHGGEVVGLSWHPEGHLLASGSADMTVHLHPIRQTPPRDDEYTDMLAPASAIPATTPQAVASTAPTATAQGTLAGESVPRAQAVQASPMVMEVSSETAVKGAASQRAPSLKGGRAQLGTQAATANAGHESTIAVGASLRGSLEAELHQQQDLVAGILATQTAGKAPAGSLTADPKDVDELRQLLTQFYTEVNPDKLVNVEVIVGDYKARGGGPAERKALNEDLRTVYGFDLSAIKAGGFPQNSLRAEPPPLQAAVAAPAAAFAQEQTWSASFPPPPEHAVPVDDMFSQMMREQGVPESGAVPEAATTKAMGALSVTSPAANHAEGLVDEEEPGFGEEDIDDFGDIPEVVGLQD